MPPAADPLPMTNRVPRAPRYSRVGRRRLGVPGLAPRAGRCSSRSSSSPTCDSSPASAAVWICVGTGGLVVGAHAQVAAGLPELGVQVLPLPDPQVVQVLLAHPAPERVARQLGPRRLEVVPQPQQREEVAALARDLRAPFRRAGRGRGERRLGLQRAVARQRRPEAAVQRLGALALLGRTLARVGDGQAGDDHEHLGQAALALGGQQHPAHPRVDRQGGEPLPDLGEPDLVVVRPAPARAFAAGLHARRARSAGGARR